MCTRRVWVGYYPGRLFNGGQMSQRAQSVLYGGETTGDANWGPMGAGTFPGNGYRWAAYQRQVYYIDTNARSQWTNLTANQPSPNCYRVAGPRNGGDVVWGIYFYFGGPGGNNC